MKTTSMMLGTIGLAIVAFASPARSEGEHTATAPDGIKWGDAPPVLNKGAKFAVLYGDPSKPGLFIVRLKIPANYKIMPHSHPTDENVTIVSGSVAFGMGDKLDPKSKAMAAGSFVSMPAKMHHYAFSKVPTVIQVSGDGPFDINYLDPKYNPAAAK